MPRKGSLTGDKRFSEIHRQGDSAANRYLVIRYLENGLGRSRFGFMINKRIGNAVVRNRIRRRLKEAVRLNHIRPGWDAVFIARKGVERTDFQELKRATDSLLLRARLIDCVPGADTPGAS